MRCPTCNEFLLSPEYHSCGPQWEVCFAANHLEDAILYGILTVYARDITDAVEKAADEDDCNSGEYSILKAGEYKAWARKLGDTEWTELVVYGESVPQYTACRKE